MARTFSSISGEIRSIPAVKSREQYVYYWVLFAVISLETFAIFFNGAFFLPAMTLCAVGMWTILAGSLLVNRSDIGLFVTWPAAIPVQLLFFFWLWVGVSVFWAYAPDLAWIEFNRTGGYLAIMMLGILVGRHPVTRRLAPQLFLAATVAAASYGMGAKLFPDIVSNTDALARISVPMGYTNAMGILVSLGVPFALYLACNDQVRWYLRIASAGSLPILFMCLFFTVSRGALLALVIGLVVYFIVAPIRMRMLGLLLLSLVPTLALAWWANGEDSLMKDKVELSLQLEAAGPLLQYLVLVIAGVVAMFSLALIVGNKFTFPAVLTRTVGVIVLASICGTMLIGSYSFLNSKPSVSQWAHDTYDEFTTGKTSKLGAARFLQVGSQGRFRLWQEAMANWEDHRLVGTGAQSFPMVHLQRQAFDSPFVKQPHGLPFRILTELGIVGFVIAYMAIATASIMAVMTVCRARGRWDRSLASALVTLSIIYLVHSGYDWDWNMFALTGAYFFFTGISVGWYSIMRNKPNLGGRRYRA